jgi:hypothetical protein
LEGRRFSHSAGITSGSLMIHFNDHFLTYHLISNSNYTWRRARMKAKAPRWAHQSADHCRWLSLSLALAAVRRFSVLTQSYVRVSNRSSSASFAIISHCRERFCHVVTHASAPFASVSIFVKLETSPSTISFLSLQQRTSTVRWQFMFRELRLIAS